ncbi:uncharacterized protein K02A2.6-like [Cydia pomonella]|uniref:uncharacterized protein K02A2.6-like n=1 Tax=Cydia pomonella TaxID=82600 RepID=UPI002ADDEA4F|nr:uncharacterized protein K02A2.6-like [Cydia pomonella]
MSIGKIGAFDVHKDNWDLYVERLGQYFVVNDVKPAVQVATLITVMGSEAYELMANLCSPDKPSTKEFDDLVAVMKKHLQPTRSTMAERFKFRQRTQRSDETIAEYTAELKKLTKDCDFQEASLKENLRDRFVCGIRNDSIRQKLFTEDNLTFERAFKMAVAMEAAESHAALVQDRSTIEEGVSSSMIATAVHQLATVKRDKRQSAEAASTERYGPRGPKVTQGDGTKGAMGADKRRVVTNSADWKGGQTQQCSACGGQHGQSSCKFRAYVCRVCNKEGHLKKMCPNLRKNVSFHAMLEEQAGYQYSDSDSNGSEEVNNFSIDAKKLKKYGPYMVQLKVNNVNLVMEVDTGSAISCISYDCYSQLFPECPLKASNLNLCYYTDISVKPVGKILPSVQYNKKCKELDLYVMVNGKTSLLGRQWIKELGILPDLVKSVNCNNVSTKHIFDINDFSSRYCEVFEGGLGRFTGGTVGFRLREGAAPVFLRARPLAYALREPVERALDQLVADGVITPVNSSDWATPIVPVMKKDGTIRVCADFKLTLNRCLEVDRFPLPRVDDLLAKLYGGTRFTKLDLSQAYAQFELDESKRFTVINTHKGLFMYNRLIYGLASSPGIFQRKLEQLFGDLPRVGIFLDDLIITGEDDETHLKTLHEVFRRLKTYGLKVRKDKCTFFSESVTYLGFVISKHGVHTCPEKIEAIKKVPEPNSITELRSFIGLVMYYAKFVRNISTVLTPFYKLLKKGVTYQWNQECSEAFRKIKEILTSSEVLAHYSLDLPVVLTCDASSLGVGAVVSHITPDGERPVAYASRTLNAAEKGYSQIEREALSIIFGVRKFHQYLYGREFTLRTDHKPLVSIFGEKKGIPVMAASRLQRWAVLLAGYNFNIEYVRSESNAADALSRLPVNKSVSLTKEVTYLNFVQDFLPIDKKMVQVSTEKDSVLRRIVSYLQTGWPSSVNDREVQPYFLRRNELYMDRGCMVWGYRLVIPEVLREKLLRELHVGHMGIVKMKSMARSVMWWPGIDADVERTCRSCGTCVAESSAPPRAPPQPWRYLTDVWTRLHIDFLGPIQGRTFLILIDSTSKWLEVFQMQSTTAKAVIKVLRETFSRFGLPREVVSDNGPPFTSQEYKSFMTHNRVKVTFAAAYHPASNGAAEGAVKLCKRAIKKAMRDGGDIDAALQAYLLAYRNVEHSTTGVSPAELLQRRKLRSRLDLLRDGSVEDKVKERQTKQITYAGGTSREFNVGENVWYRNYSGGSRWLDGRIQEKTSSRNYIVAAENGSPIHRHVDQIKSRWMSTYEDPSPSSPTQESDGLRSERNDTSSVTVEDQCPAESGGAAVTAPSPPRSNTSESTDPPVNLPRPTLRPRDKLRSVKRYGFEID